MKSEVGELTFLVVLRRLGLDSAQVDIVLIKYIKRFY